MSDVHIPLHLNADNTVRIAPAEVDRVNASPFPPRKLSELGTLDQFLGEEGVLAETEAAARVRVEGAKIELAARALAINAGWPDPDRMVIASHAPAVVCGAYHFLDPRDPVPIWSLFSWEARVVLRALRAAAA